MDLDTLKAAIDGYQAANADALAALRQELSTAKTDATEARASLLEIEKKLNRPIAPGEQQESKALLSALGTFAKTGADEQKSLFVGSSPDGGFLVAPQMASAVRMRVQQISPIRQIARVISLDSGDGYEEPVFDDLPEATWVGEVQARPTTGTPSMKKTSIPLNEIYANPPVSQKLLDTSAYDVGNMLVRLIGKALAQKEGTAFISGDGLAKPEGFLTMPTALTADATRPWGTLQHVKSGHATTIKPDGLIDLSESLAPQFRPNARWVMSRTTSAVIRKLKDLQERFLWADSLVPGMPAMLLGYPVTIADDMPAVGAGLLPVAFGDFEEGYTVVDSRQMTVLRDPFTQKPYVLFYTYSRVGGGVTDFDAIKVLSIQA